MARTPASTHVSIRIGTFLLYDMAMVAEEDASVPLDDKSAPIYGPWSERARPDQPKHEWRNAFIREAVSREIDRRLEWNRRHLKSDPRLDDWVVTTRKSNASPPYHEAGTEPPTPGRPPGQRGPRV